VKSLQKERKLPLTEHVKFLARLQTQNRIQIPVEIRQRFKLEAKQFLRVQIRHIDSFHDETFFAKMKPDGRITVPWEITWTLEIKPGHMLRVMLYPEEQE
jgi:bifunctional DNA-binding transcriptional regulator/antitoxin component of YhaV-PrlF toxin-antitoxin module